MRKQKAQEKMRASEAPSPTPSSCQSSLSSNNHAVDSHASKKAGEESFYDTGGPNMTGSTGINVEDQDVVEQGYYSMDDIWKDIAMSEENILQPVYDGNSEEGCNFSCPPMPSPSWEYSSDPLWMMDEEQSKVLFPKSDQFFYCYEQGSAFLTG